MVLDEGIPVQVTYVDLHTPERHYPWKRTRSSGALALTRERLAAFVNREKVLDIRLDDPNFKQIEWSTGRPDELWATFDAHLIQPGWSGRIDIAFSTPLTPQFFARLSRFSKRDTQ